jgi:tetratricopeptide (TPR) repeat protein
MLGFRRAAEHAAHSSAKAYFDASLNEVGLLIDMAQFNRFYGSVDKQPDRYPLVLAAFIAYAMDAFNEDSGHELTHVAQQQTQRPAYALPAIREGEAEVQGMTRRRDGLVFDFLYNTPDWWSKGRFAPEEINGRLKALTGVGRPMSPMEVDRLVALKALWRSGRLIPAGQLLGMDFPAFFSGSLADIESRYAQSWALCLLAIRDKAVSQQLVHAIDARLAKTPRADLEAELDRRLNAFIDDPHQLLVTREAAWKDAERFYAIDPIFVGVFYAWIHVIDPGDPKALIYLGDALYAGGNMHGAMRYYLAGQVMDSRSALPPLRIGDVLNQIGEGDAALRAWREAVATSRAGDDEAMYRRQAKERPIGKPPTDDGARERDDSQALSSALGTLLKTGPQWLGFTEYPRARQLCAERVMGSMGEILDWRLFATEDETGRVVAFYKKQDPGQAESSDAAVTLRRADGRILTISPASTAEHLPGCDQKPQARDRALILVSQMKN